MGEVKNHRLSWQKKMDFIDDYGNVRTAGFEEQFERWAEVRPDVGSESVSAERLAGTYPVLIIIYKDSQTQRITAAWRAVDVNTGIVYSLTSPAVDLRQDRHELVIQALSGAGVTV